MIAIDITNLQFRQMPEDGGQIVEISYACDETWLYCHVYDRSDMEESYSRIRLAEKSRYDFEPQNGLLPKTLGKWQKINVKSDEDCRNRES